MTEKCTATRENGPAHAAIHAHPERDRTADAPKILASGLVAHVGFVDTGRPVVIPMTYHFAEAEPRRLYLHGGVKGRLMAHVATGAPVCVTVTEVDGLVYSRTALNHSVNYRSVVLFARAAVEQPSAADRERILEAMIARYFPGRTAGADYAPASAAQLAGTALVALEIEQWSAKVREGGPNGPGDDDPARAGTAGVLAVGHGDSAATGADRARAAERGKAAPSRAAPPSSGPTVYFAVRMVPGPAWNAALPMRSQAGWTDHAAFMDQLAAEGFIVLGGPLGGGEVKLHIVQAPSEAAVRSRLAADPWSVSRQLDVWDVRPWTILLDGRSAAPRP